MRLSLVAGACASAAFAIAAGASAQGPDPLKMPAITNPLPPPADKTPRASVELAPYRYDDLLWENDRTAHRIYGRPLEAAEPPSGSGIDAWGKNVPWSFADRQLRTGDQHAYHGEGLDFYNVGTGRGDGGLGVWQDNKLWTSRNYASYRILKDGPDVADFEVRYAPWPVGVDRNVSEVRRFTLPLGTAFTRFVSTFSSNRSGPLIVGVGIGKHTSTASDDGEVTVDRARGVMSWWGPDTGDHGRMAIALRVDPAQIVDVKDDFDNHLILLRVEPGKPFVYYSGSAWSKGEGGIRTRAQWDRYAADAKLDFGVPAGTR